MTYQKALPVVVSICIILAVAYLRNRSRTLAVILGTMPINLPLALWVTFGGSGASQEEIVAFVRSLLWGLAATGYGWSYSIWSCGQAAALPWASASAISHGPR